MLSNSLASRAPMAVVSRVTSPGCDANRVVDAANSKASNKGSSIGVNGNARHSSRQTFMQVQVQNHWQMTSHSSAMPTPLTAARRPSQSLFAAALAAAENACGSAVRARNAGPTSARALRGGPEVPVRGSTPAHRAGSRSPYKPSGTADERTWPGQADR